MVGFKIGELHQSKTDPKGSQEIPLWTRYDEPHRHHLENSTDVISLRNWEQDWFRNPLLVTNWVKRNWIKRQSVCWPFKNGLKFLIYIISCTSFPVYCLRFSKEHVNSRVYYKYKIFPTMQHHTKTYYSNPRPHPPYKMFLAIYEWYRT